MNFNVCITYTDWEVLGLHRPASIVTTPTFTEQPPTMWVFVQLGYPRRTFGVCKDVHHSSAGRPVWVFRACGGSGNPILVNGLRRGTEAGKGRAQAPGRLHRLR